MTTQNYSQLTDWDESYWCVYTIIPTRFKNISREFAKNVSTRSHFSEFFNQIYRCPTQGFHYFVDATFDLLEDEARGKMVFHNETSQETSSLHSLSCWDNHHHQCLSAKESLEINHEPINFLGHKCQAINGRVDNQLTEKHTNNDLKINNQMYSLV